LLTGETSFQDFRDTFFGELAFGVDKKSLFGDLSSKQIIGPEGDILFRHGLFKNTGFLNLGVQRTFQMTGRKRSGNRAQKSPFYGEKHQNEGLLIIFTEVPVGPEQRWQDIG